MSESGNWEGKLLKPKTKPLLGGVNLGRTNCALEKQTGSRFRSVRSLLENKNFAFHANRPNARPRVVCGSGGRD